MRPRGKRIASVQTQGKRIGVFAIDDQATRRLLRIEREAEARDLFPEPPPAKEVLEKTLAHAISKRWGATAAADALVDAQVPRVGSGGVALALAAGAVLAMVLHHADLGARVAGAAGVAFAVWLTLCLPSLSWRSDWVWHRAMAWGWEIRARRLERRLAVREAILRRRREHVEIETAIDLAALASGIAEGAAAAPQRERPLDQTTVPYRKGAILDVVQ